MTRSKQSLRETPNPANLQIPKIEDLKWATYRDQGQSQRYQNCIKRSKESRSVIFLAGNQTFTMIAFANTIFGTNEIKDKLISNHSDAFL